jgi:hypothetical protein
MLTPRVRTGIRQLEIAEAFEKRPKLANIFQMAFGKSVPVSDECQFVLDPGQGHFVFDPGTSHDWSSKARCDGSIK